LPDAAVWLQDTVELTDCPIEIPDEAYAGYQTFHALEPFIIRIDGNTKEADLSIIEPLAMGLDTVQYFSGCRISRRPEKTQHDIPTGNGIEAKAFSELSATMEPRGWLAD
jgi:hypothetical protein